MVEARQVSGDEKRSANAKHQTPNTKKPPTSKLQPTQAGESLDIGVWNLFGIWCLVFGVFIIRR
jgi:hypothetical protein